MDYKKLDKLIVEDEVAGEQYDADRPIVTRIHIPGVGQIIGEISEAEPSETVFDTNRAFFILNMETDYRHRHKGVATALFRYLCKRFKTIIPGSIVTEHADKLHAMMQREGHAAGCRVTGGYCDPDPEGDAKLDRPLPQIDAIKRSA